MEYILGFLLMGMEDLAAILLCDAFLKRRYTGARFYLTLIGFLLFSYLLANIPFNHMPSLRLVFNVAIHLTEICCLYYGKIPMKMILCVLWIGLIWGFDSVVCMGIARLHSISIPVLLADPLSCTVTGLVSKLSLLTSTAIVKQLHPYSRNIPIRWPYFFLLLPFPIASVASMVILWESRNAAVLSQRPITICLFISTRHPTPESMTSLLPTAPPIRQTQPARKRLKPPSATTTGITGWIQWQSIRWCSSSAMTARSMSLPSPSVKRTGTDAILPTTGLGPTPCPSPPILTHGVLTATAIWPSAAIPVWSICFSARPAKPTRRSSRKPLSGTS